MPGAAEKNKGEWTCLRPVWAPPPASGGFFSGAICSPPSAKACGFVPGSKIFTSIPRRFPRSAGFTAARFAPRSPQSLAAPSRGAKSSQKFRAAACLRRLFSGAICSPLPAKPCGTVPGSKIFTEIPRRFPRPAGFFRLDSYNFFLKLY